jgi:hypothetical protein
MISEDAMQVTIYVVGIIDDEVADVAAGSGENTVHGGSHLL